MTYLVVFHGPAFKHRFCVMPLYFFSIPNGRYAGSSDCGAEFADRDAAWKELTGVCGDMVGGISRKLADEPADDSHSSYETVVCRACSRLHFINRSNGKLLGAEEPN